MPTVTAILPDPRGSGGFTVFLDGASFALVAAADVRDLGLVEGAALAPDALERVERRAEVFAARLGALRILAFRALPSTEIERRLVRKGYVPATAGEAVGSLVARRPHQRRGIRAALRPHPGPALPLRARAPVARPPAAGHRAGRGRSRGE